MTKEQKKQYDIQYRLKNRIRMDAYRRKYYEVNRSRRRDQDQCRLYGITLAQNGKCANLNCDYVFKDVYEAHTDHNHKTGKVRGLLCGNCNRGVGCFKDSLLLLHGIVDYLKAAEQ